MTGIVTAAREAIVRIHLRGRGLDVDLDAVIDTGFSDFLSLPQSWIAGLALPYLFTDDVTLADGTIVAVDLYEAVVVWDGNDITVTVHCLEGSPLVGMSLLWDHLLTAQVVDGGGVTITPIT